MTVNGNYSQPVTVNGYLCWNCTDVDNAKRHIDPQHPKSGPYGIDASEDPTLSNKTPEQRAVLFGGSLGALSKATLQSQSNQEAQSTIGSNLDVVA